MRKSLVITLVVVLVLTTGVAAVSAQGGGPGRGGRGPMGPAQGMGGMMGRGHMNGMDRGMGQGAGPMWNMNSARNMGLITPLAEALGLGTDALLAELRAGKTVAEIAAAQGVALSTVVNAAMTSHIEHLAALVAAGRLTQAEADARAATMTATITARFATGMPCQAAGAVVTGGQ